MRLDSTQIQTRQYDLGAKSDMTYYQHRISHWWEWSHPLLEHGNLLSIGYADFATNEFITNHQCDNWQKVAETVQKAWDYKALSPYSLQRFLQMDQGDTVIVPSWGGTFHAYKITSNRRLIPSDLENLNLIHNKLQTSLRDTRLEFRGEIRKLSLIHI